MTYIASFDPSLVSAVAGIVASIIAAGTSALFSSRAKKIEDELSPKRITVANSKPPEPTLEELQYRDSRLIEASKALNRHEAATKWSSRSATSLAISQYVVGATLATSFIQNTFPDWAVGFLGLIVLMASTIYQQFRPDLRMSSARRKATMLKAAILRAEDGLFAIRSAHPNAPTILDIRNEITSALIQVEQSDLEETFLPNSNNKSDKPNG